MTALPILQFGGVPFSLFANMALYVKLSRLATSNCSPRPGLSPESGALQPEFSSGTHSFLLRTRLALPKRLNFSNHCTVENAG
jgi:hypothetical protein